MFEAVARSQWRKLKDKNITGLFTSRGIRKPQGVWNLRMLVLLPTEPNSQHQPPLGADQGSEAPERMLLAVESERTNANDEHGQTVGPAPWAQLLVLTGF